MSHDLESPYVEGVPDWDALYRARGDEVVATRPIFTGDVERLPDGALGVLGYDYTSSGIQAAHLVDRIFKGEKPEHIPFERYRKLTFGLNLDVAKELGISFPPELVEKATVLYKNEEKKTQQSQHK